MLVTHTHTRTNTESTKINIEFCCMQCAVAPNVCKLYNLSPRPTIVLADCCLKFSKRDKMFGLHAITSNYFFLLSFASFAIYPCILHSSRRFLFTTYQTATLLFVCVCFFQFIFFLIFKLLLCFLFCFSFLQASCTRLCSQSLPFVVVAAFLFKVFVRKCLMKSGFTLLKRWQGRAVNAMCSTVWYILFCLLLVLFGCEKSFCSI